MGYSYTDAFLTQHTLDAKEVEDRGANKTIWTATSVNIVSKELNVQYYRQEVCTSRVRGFREKMGLLPIWEILQLMEAYWKVERHKATGATRGARCIKRPLKTIERQ